MYVTFAELFTFGLLICAILALVVSTAGLIFEIIKYINESKKK